MTAAVKETPAGPPPLPFTFHGEGVPPYFEYQTTLLRTHSGERVPAPQRIEPRDENYAHFKALWDRCQHFEAECAALQDKLGQFEALKRENDALRDELAALKSLQSKQVKKG